MDPSKVSAVSEWPQPHSRKQLQRFLGFANFYRRFIRNYSSLAAPLHALTSPGTSFVWTPAAEQAFQALKRRICSAPILTQPDPKLQFIVEVDASDLGVGAVLSQRSKTDDKVHPCAFFSKKLSPAEKHYDVGNRELLALKLALEEWRHWLEGTDQPFLVWTDHKNLDPGSKNTKPDALSRLYDADTSPLTPATILPAACIVGAVTWEIESAVRSALEGVQVPEGCSPNRLFVPVHLRS
ncbi:hypothetical protein LDENG_00012350 [Lucifuga dentata]|nr:hypothetical protein LDENG_00012350 [Lucifuga dentata]